MNMPTAEQTGPDYYREVFLSLLDGFPDSPPNETIFLESKVQGGQFYYGWQDLQHGAHTVRVATSFLYWRADGSDVIVPMFPLGGLMHKFYNEEGDDDHAEAEVHALVKVKHRLLEYGSQKTKPWWLPTVAGVARESDLRIKAILTDAYPAFPYPAVIRMLQNVREHTGLADRNHIERLISLVNLIVLYDGIDISQQLGNVGIIHDDLLDRTREFGNILFCIPYACAPWVDFGKSKVSAKRRNSQVWSDPVAFYMNMEQVFLELEKMEMPGVQQWRDLIMESEIRFPAVLKRALMKSTAQRVMLMLERKITQTVSAGTLNEARSLISDEIIGYIYAFRMLEVDLVSNPDAQIPNDECIAIFVKGFYEMFGGLREELSRRVNTSRPE